MSAAVTRHPATAGVDPVDDFSHCHEGILAGLHSFAGLPPLLQAARRAQEIASQVAHLMDGAVAQHHAEEEQELFPAVLASAARGAERDRVQALVWRLTDEHREIEGLWKKLRPQVRKAAAGKAVPMNQQAVDLLVAVYRMHAQNEEREFLPLSREILGRNGNHMAALGLALHMRHAPLPIPHI